MKQLYRILEKVIDSNSVLALYLSMQSEAKTANYYYGKGVSTQNNIHALYWMLRVYDNYITKGNILDTLHALNKSVGDT